jgi:hypothetical protein
LGEEIDFSQDTYASSHAVLQAATYGHCSVVEATSVLNERLEEQTAEVEIMKIRGAIDSLRMVSDVVVSHTTGVLGYIWSRVTNVVMKRGDAVSRVELGKSKTGALTSTMARPSKESEFYEMCHLFLMVIVGLGMTTHVILMKFQDDVVWATIRARESFQCAFELKTIYLREVDRDTTGTVHLGNVFRRGGQDTLMAEARRNSVMFFRTRGGEPRIDDRHLVGAQPNGKHNSQSDKPCMDFNMGRACKRVDSSGKCLFNHKCNQFVSDKGKGGLCFGTHARCNGCDYDQSKKLFKPATE